MPAPIVKAPCLPAGTRPRGGEGERHAARSGGRAREARGRRSGVAATWTSPRLRRAVRLANSQTADEVRPSFPESAHPDAIRRRKEAEERRRKHREEAAKAAELAKAAKWWQVGTGELQNVHEVDCPLDLAKKLVSGVAKDNGRGLVVCVFYAPWCPGCRTLHPKLNQLALEHSSVTFLRISGEAPGDALVEALGVSELPFFQLYTADGLYDSLTANIMPVKLAKLRRTVSLAKDAAESATHRFRWPEDPTPPALRKAVSAVQSVRPSAR